MPPFGRPGLFVSDQEYISKWIYELGFETKRRKNNAAVMAPPKPPLGALSKSAWSGSIKFSYGSQNGKGHTGSL